MKKYIITDTSYNLKCLNESVKGEKIPYIVGVFSSALTENGNGRKYPREILEREVNSFINNKVKYKAALGELEHPSQSSINLANACILVENMEWKNNDVYGRARVLEGLPSGKILKELIDAEVRFGISSRGTGSVNEDGWVNEDYNLICYDIVSNPSVGNAWVNGLYECIDYNPKPSIKEAQEVLKRQIWQVLEKLEK
jgi:hypothetical protein